VTQSVGVPEPRPDHCKALTRLALSLHDKLDKVGRCSLTL